ncbi:MAG: DsbA family protein, partial [Proteobacteria bacterium]|nr:DsbA family protein [Pseudomonadota bacterium]
AAQVEKETAEGKNAGISGTPTFVINGKKVVGAQPFDNFKKEIDAILAK